MKNIVISAFTGMQGETNIARTYLMAKNIMDSSRVRDEFSYYDIGTNVIMKTPGADGDIYLLSDFQKVKLDAPLYDIDEEGVVETNEDTDKDGIIDRNIRDGDCYCNKGDGHYIKWVIVIKKSYLSHKK